ncbi:MAG: STAS domain-containing protein [Thermodesulfobacteriota bacterium]
MTKKNLFHELADLFRDYRNEIAELWQRQLIAAAGNVITTIGEENIRKRSEELLGRLIKSMPAGDDVKAQAYDPVRKYIQSLSVDLTAANCTPGEVATYIFSLKDALLSTSQGKFPQKGRLNEAVTLVNKLIDKLGLISIETYLETKEKLIREQQLSLIETSAPVVKVWDRILLVPLIGIIDSERTQVVMNNVLSGIEETQSKVVILDITGIPAVDTLVARHLIATASAVQLMGAHCVITGISARIAQTVIQMGIDLAGVNTKATMADGLREALDLLGQKIVKHSIKGDLNE